MRKLMGGGAAALGAVGVLLCVTAIGAGWLTAARIVDRIDRAAARLDGGLDKTDACFARIEARANAIRTELDEVHQGVETLSADDPDLPRVREAVDRLVLRLSSSLERIDAIAESVRSFAAMIRAAADFVDQLTDETATAERAREAADAIDRAAAALNAPKDKIEASRSATATHLLRGLGNLTREAVAGTDALADGLAAARAEIVVAREGTVKYRDAAALRVYATATANSLIFAWAGVGQICLFNWGRRRFAAVPPPPA